MKLQVKYEFLKKKCENTKIFLDIIRHVVYIIIVNCEIHSKKQYQLKLKRGFKNEKKILRKRRLSI